MKYNNLNNDQKFFKTYGGKKSNKAVAFFKQGLEHRTNAIY